MKVALSMIVKNEEKIIERCLNSVQLFVDEIYVCDTGSTDETQTLIQKWCTAWSKGFEDRKWKLSSHPFVDFATSRTIALDETIHNSNADYILLLDADMEIIIPKAVSFDKSYLVAKSYYIEQRSHSLVYSNVRLIRRQSGWRYVGKTHEVIICDQLTFATEQPERLDKSLLYINDLGDGGSKSNKFERDECLLQEGLREVEENDPHNLKSRYTFYLAQTLFAQQKFRKALVMYEICLRENSWSEQTFYCCYMCGECCYLLDEQEKILYFMCQAFIHSPLRAEPYFRILRYLNDKKLYDLACSISSVACEKADQQLASSKDFLFQDQMILKYQIRIEASVADYYNGKNRYKQLINRLLHDLNLDEHAPKYIRDVVNANATHL